jgi:hypothetical protein
VRRGHQLNRYVAVIALLALGPDEVIADAVWELASEVTAVTASFGMHKLKVAQIKDAPQRCSFVALYAKVPITTGR